MTWDGYLVMIAAVCFALLAGWDFGRTAGQFRLATVRQKMADLEADDAAEWQKYQDGMAKLRILHQHALSGWRAVNLSIVPEENDSRIAGIMEASRAEVRKHQKAMIEQCSPEELQKHLCPGLADQIGWRPIPADPGAKLG